MKVLQYPLTQITFLFVFGIVFNRYLNLEFKSGLVFLVLSFLLLSIVFLLHFRSKRIKTIPLFSFCSLLLSFAIGNFTASIHQVDQDTNHFINSKNSSAESVHLKVIIVEKWKPTAKNNRFLAEVISLNNNEVKGKLLVNFRKDKSNEVITVGSKVALYAKVFPLQKPLNPDQFDYASFLKNKSILAQVYVDDASIKLFIAKEKNLYYYSSIFRNRVIANLQKSNFNAKELAVVHALILGQKQDLDPTVLQNYQYAGAVRILSVSGLHVGFVLLFLNFVLKIFPNTPRFRFFKMVVVIFVLWCFALVAGFSPSVVRSVTMFSFVAIGMYSRRKTYIFYTFYCSILIILIFEPSFLFDVGFQLSYLALFFILWLQPEFEKIWQPKNKVALHFWQVFTITLAAQLGTMPLSLYYFHQFPGLFFLTNLLIMFLMSVIMGVGLVFVLIAFWTKIPSYIAIILEKLIWLLNFIIEKIASFESFIFKDISFDFWMLVTLYFSIFAFGWLYIYRKFNYAALFLVSVLFFQGSWFNFDYSSRNKKDWMVLQSRNSSLILERNGQDLTVCTNRIDSGEIKKDRTIQSYNVANGTKLTECISIKNFMFYKGSKIAILDSNAVVMPELHPDILVITQSPKVNFERILGTYKPKIVVIDASNYRNVVEKVRETCLQQKIPFHAVAEKGFYRIED